MKGCRPSLVYVHIKANNAEDKRRALEQQRRPMLQLADRPPQFAFLCGISTSYSDLVLQFWMAQILPDIDDVNVPAVFPSTLFP